MIRFRNCDIQGSLAEIVQSTRDEIDRSTQHLLNNIKSLDIDGAKNDTEEIIDAFNNILANGSLTNTNQVAEEFGLASRNPTQLEEETILASKGVINVRNKTIYICDNTKNNLQIIRELYYAGLSIDQIDKFIKDGIPGDIGVIYTQPTFKIISKPNTGTFDIKYIKSLYPKIKEENVTFFKDDNIAIALTEQYITMNVSKGKAASIANIEPDQLNIRVIIFASQEFVDDGKPSVKTRGLDLNLLDNTHYNLGIEVNGTNYTIDVTNNKGTESGYLLKEIASNISDIIPDLECMTSGKELLFKTTNSGTRATIKFFYTENSSAYALGITNTIRDAIKGLKNLRRRTQSGPQADIESDYILPLVEDTPLNMLPEITFHGGSLPNSTRLSKETVTKIKEYGLNIANITAIVFRENYVEVKKPEIEATIERAIKDFKNFLNTLNINDRNIAERSLLNLYGLLYYQVYKSVETNTIDRLREDLTDSDIEYLLINFKCKGINFNMSDMEVTNNVTAIVNQSSPGSGDVSKSVLESSNQYGYFELNSGQLSNTLNLLEYEKIKKEDADKKDIAQKIIDSLNEIVIFTKDVQTLISDSVAIAEKQINTWASYLIRLPERLFEAAFDAIASYLKKNKAFQSIVAFLAIVEQLYKAAINFVRSTAEVVGAFLRTIEHLGNLTLNADLSPEATGKYIVCSLGTFSAELNLGIPISNFLAKIGDKIEGIVNTLNEIFESINEFILFILCKINNVYREIFDNQNQPFCKFINIPKTLPDSSQLLSEIENLFGLLTAIVKQVSKEGDILNITIPKMKDKFKDMFDSINKCGLPSFVDPLKPKTRLQKTLIDIEGI